MANKDLTIALKLLADSGGLDRGLRTGEKSISRFADTAKREFHGMGAAYQSMTGKLGLLTGGIGAGLIAKGAVQQFAEAEHSLRGVGNAGGIAKERLASVAEELLGIAKSTNQWRQDLIGGLNVLVSSGMEFERSISLIKDIGDAATGSQASIEDLASTVFALDHNLRVLPKDMGKSLNILTNEGFAGAFELKDMARYFPKIAAESQKLNISGPNAAASLGAALQVSRGNTGTPEEAATNLYDYMNKLTAKSTTHDLMKEFGVNWEKDFRKKVLKAKDPLLASVEFMHKKIGENPFAMNKVFGNVQTIQFLTAMFNKDDKGKTGIERYKEIYNNSLNDPHAIQKAKSRNMDTLQEQWKQTGIIMDSIVQKSKALNESMSLGAKLLEGMNKKLGDKDVTLEGLAGGAGAVGVGGYLISRLAKGGLSKAFGELGGTAAGVAVGKGLEQAAGVTPVFVVNMPKSGLSGDIPDGVAKTATAVGAGAFMPQLFSNLRTSAAILGGSSLSALPMYGSGAMATSAGLGLAAGGIGFGAGYGANKLMEDTKAGNWLDDAVGKAVRPLADRYFQSGIARAGKPDGGNVDYYKMHGAIERAIDASKVGDLGRQIESTITKISEKKATLTLRIIGGSAKAQGFQSEGFNLNIDTGLLPIGP